MDWRLLEKAEPFTFFVDFRRGAACDPATYDVCVWFPGGRLDVAQTVAHIFVGFVLQLGFTALAVRRPESPILRLLHRAGVPALAAAKEVYDGFAPALVGPVPIGGSGFDVLDIAFSLLGQLLLYAVAIALTVPLRARPAGDAP